ncbi:MAG: cache domain-containing protein, partial [Bacteroidales bacterium]|nr:cache domain-containing protein [Bacteroidales bacterium]
MIENTTIEKKKMIKELTHIAINIINEYHHNHQDGLYSMNEAKQKATERIRNLSYGEDKSEYFWIIDTNSVIIMHPYRPDMEGNSLHLYQDSNGIFVFNEAIDMVKNGNEGYINYTWQWKSDSTLIVPKISFVKGYDNWNWIIGTGIYLEDIEKRAGEIRKDGLNFALSILFFLFTMTFTIIYYNIRLEKNRRNVLSKLTQNEEKFRNLFHTSNDIIIISTIQGDILDVNNSS